MDMMKPITWLASIAVSVTALTTLALAEPSKGWTTDYQAALVKAKAENKSVLLDFTGSDWCPPCKMMHAKVFSKAEFVDEASKKFVLVEVDMPRGDKEVRERNEPLVKEFKVNAYPTVVLVDAEGKEFTRFIASEHPEIPAFLARLDASLDKQGLD